MLIVSLCPHSPCFGNGFFSPQYCSASLWSLQNYDSWKV